MIAQQKKRILPVGLVALCGKVRMASAVNVNGRAKT
jgi:hypothetical protein